MPNDLKKIPKSWIKVRFSEVCEIFDSMRIPVNRNERLRRVSDKSEDILFPYYGATGQVGLIDDFIFEGKHILLGEDGAPFLDPVKDKAYLATGKFWVNNHAHIIKAKISDEYLCHFLNQTDYSEYVTGTTRLKLTKSSLQNIWVTVAPLNEQRRIVAKIEALFSELDKGIESLKTAQAQLKVYRQAVLQHAFEGKLTADWRARNGDELELACVLSKRLNDVREQEHCSQHERWKEAVAQWKARGKNGRKPSKPRPPKALKGLTKEDLADLPSLPEAWAWGKLGWMTCGVEYGTAAKSSEKGTVPVLRMGNIQEGKFDWTDLVWTSDNLEIAKYSLHPGDVLFNRTNSPELVGKAAYYRGEQPALFAGYLIRVNQIDQIVDGQFLTFFLNSHIAKKHGNKVKTDGVNQSNINGEKLQNYPFPYCSVEEQIEIVRNVEEKLSIVDKIRLDIAEQLERSQALRQSILKKAFSGQLVPQDPRDEPASVLLERIRAEKAEATSSRRPRTTPTKSKKRAA